MLFVRENTAFAPDGGADKKVTRFFIAGATAGTTTTYREHDLKTTSRSL
jgi:hypothetical protein